MISAFEYSQLEPKQRHLIYDLVKEAGVDVGDWANYKRPEHPSTNPKYCYEWSFVGEDRVVLCLWHSEIEHDGEKIFQTKNYLKAEIGHPLSPTQQKRALRMDRAIQLARNEMLPVRVVVVAGSRRQDDNSSASHVTFRQLDPVAWHVASYSEDGTCSLVRGERYPPRPHGHNKLARIAFNSSGWRRPTGEASDQESDQTYNAQNRFGHEDWLFRSEWALDGWRYAFIQGMNKVRGQYIGHPLNIALYTVQPDKKRRLVATLYGVEALTDQECEDALNAFKAKGWLETMRREVSAIAGNVDALGDPKWAPHILNVRFRLSQVEVYSPDVLLPDSEWIRNRHRYMLYDFSASERSRIEQQYQHESERKTPFEYRPLFRKGTKPICYSPEHIKIQNKLFAELQQEYGVGNIWLERDCVDVTVQTPTELIFFEIKSDLDSRSVLRQALGQILEYAYHPARQGRAPDRVVIVGRVGLSTHDQAYLTTLCERFGLPLSYRAVVP